MMMKVNDMKERHVSLVLRLDNMLTGEAIDGFKDVSVASGDGLLIPVVKPGGYFVFIDRPPKSVSIKSREYHDAQIETDGDMHGVLRFALIPRIMYGRSLNVPEGAYVGFSCRSYALAHGMDESSSSIRLSKGDYADVTDLYHALLTQEGAKEAVYLKKNLGGGEYALYAPPSRAYPARKARAVALYRTAGGRIPIPPKEDRVLIMSDGIITTEYAEVR